MDDLVPLPARTLVGRPVRVGAVEVGTVTDVLASRSLGYVLGLEVRGEDGHERFVPWVAAVVQPDSIALTSVFSLLSSSELALYVDNGLRVSELEEDVLVARDGTLARPSEPRLSASASVHTSRSKRSVHAVAKRSMP